MAFFPVSADATEQTIKKAYEAGGCYYISKPYHEAEILAKVRKHLQLEPSVMENRFGNVNIAVVDDNDLNRNIIAEILTELNIHFHVYSGASEFLNDLNLKNYSIVLMDIEMPKINGREALEELKKKQ